jgi:hypothetical protein
LNASKSHVEVFFDEGLGHLANVSMRSCDLCITPKRSHGPRLDVYAVADTETTVTYAPELLADKETTRFRTAVGWG